MPFSAVSKPVLKYFFSKHLPRLHIPDELTLRKKYLRDVYQPLVVKVKTEIAPIGVINIMFDDWSDRYNKSHYLGLRVQYIKND